MSNAANAYGQKWVLNSGIALQNAQRSMGDFNLQQQQINQQYNNAQQERDVALQREQQRYGISQFRTQQDISTYQQQRSVGAVDNTVQAITQLWAAGKLGAYAGSVEQLNQANAYRSMNNMNPATPGAQGLPNLIYNP